MNVFVAMVSDNSCSLRSVNECEVLEKTFNPHITLGDGTVVSVQANKYGYNLPRINNSPDGYSHVEVMWMHHNDKPVAWGNRDDGVYGYMPLEMVADQCWYHGGIVSGKLPKAQLRLTHQKD